MENIQYIKVELNKIGDRYADLRIIQPQAESSMERSMRLYGQMTPVIIGCEANKTYEMVDGFKRLRSGRKLGYTTLQAKIFSRGRHALKAAIIHLNTKTRTIASLETGLVIRSLYREDGLSQVEIAGLLGRHKSFVCRRLRLVENLSEEVLDHLKPNGCNTKKLHDQAIIGKSSNALLLNIFLTTLRPLRQAFFNLPVRTNERRKIIFSAFSLFQNMPAPLMRRLMTRRIALSTVPLPVGRPSSRNVLY